MVATNENAESTLGSIDEGIGISDLVFNATLQFNLHYIVTFKQGGHSVDFGELSTLPFIVELDIVHLCTRA